MRAITITSILTILATNSIAANAENAVANGAWAGPYIGAFIGSSTGEDKSVEANTAASDYYSPADPNGLDRDGDGSFCYNSKSGRILPGLNGEQDCLQQNPNARWFAKLIFDPENPPELFDPSNPISEIIKTFVKNNEGGNRFLGGVKAGYNWQKDRYVYGLEADFTKIKDKSVSAYSSSESILYADSNPYLDNQKSPDNAGNTSGKIDSTVRASDVGVDWFGTVRGRVGYLVNDDFLPFVTAGLAYGKVRNKAKYEFNDYSYSHDETNTYDEANYDVAPVTTAGTIGGSDTEYGWTVGAGFDYRIKDNIIANVTYLYVDLGSKKESSIGYDNAVGDGSASRFAAAISDVDPAFHTIRVGINWQF